ncbi:MAG TPA: patatin-like protein [Allosphingosinicella sp.]|jgi:patatin-related protein
MRDKELRLALICYGGVSLAVYMHGITREIWHLLRASAAFHGEAERAQGSEGVYFSILERAAADSGVSVRVLADILAGASAGGINAVFLADAIASGSSIEPLTDLWLEAADVDRLLDPEVGRFSRFAKNAALPIAWALSGRRHGADEEESGDAALRGEIRAKVANFVRARWFAPPFGGSGFTTILLDALEAMKREGTGAPLLPPGHPLDLSVTVTDFRGFPQRLRLNSPPEVLETEHRLTLSFRSEGGGRLAPVPDLVFAARATASFPGAFPPFEAAELDAALESRGAAWPSRTAFLERALQRPVEEAEKVVLIDGAILANAPFQAAIAALQNRPARREVDRRFVYLDPKPGMPSFRGRSSGAAGAEMPGFFATIFGALSDIPREQPIRDNLEAIEARSARIRRMNRILEAIRPQVEAAIGRAFGGAFFLLAPTAERLGAWRSRAHLIAARQAGFAYAAYGQLKLSRVVEETIRHLCRTSGAETERSARRAIWGAVRGTGAAADDAFTASGTRAEAIEFLGRFDVGFRIRRLRFLSHQLGGEAPKLRSLFDELIGRYRAAAAASDEPYSPGEEDAALDRLAARLALRDIDAEADARIADALAAMTRAERKPLIVAYLGFPFYDIATFPLLQEDGRDEYDPVKVDRISPDDATAIRAGTAATLKGIHFNSFGAFFSRSWRENDYLWGRLHGADRLVDILLSTIPGWDEAGAFDAKALKQAAFRAILAEEKPRLTGIPALFEELEREIG